MPAALATARAALAPTGLWVSSYASTITLAAVITPLTDSPLSTAAAAAFAVASAARDALPASFGSACAGAAGGFSLNSIWKGAAKVTAVRGIPSILGVMVSVRATSLGFLAGSSLGGVAVSRGDAKAFSLARKLAFEMTRVFPSSVKSWSSN